MNVYPDAASGCTTMATDDTTGMGGIMVQTEGRGSFIDNIKNMQENSFPQWKVIGEKGKVQHQMLGLDISCNAFGITEETSSSSGESTEIYDEESEDSINMSICYDGNFGSVHI